jgi:hypothetical protein
VSFAFVFFFGTAGAVLIAAVAHVHRRPPVERGENTILARIDKPALAGSDGAKLQNSDRVLGLPIGRPREVKERKPSIGAKNEPPSVMPDEGQIVSSRITVPVEGNS